MNFRFFLRMLVAIIVFFCLLAFFYFAGFWLYGQVIDHVPIGEAGTERGEEAAIDVFGIGPLINVILSFAGSVLAYAATFRDNWTWPFALKSLLFLVFASVSAANYADADVILGKEPQAVLNIAMIGVSVGVVFVMQKYISQCKDEALYYTFLFILFLIVYAFIAVPMWYTLAFLSWSIGAGSLKSLDGAAKVFGAVLSIVAVLGVEWKAGRLIRKSEE